MVTLYLLPFSIRNFIKEEFTNLSLYKSLPSLLHLLNCLIQNLGSILIKS